MSGRIKSLASVVRTVMTMPLDEEIERLTKRVQRERTPQARRQLTRAEATRRYRAELWAIGK